MKNILGIVALAVIGGIAWMIFRPKGGTSASAPMANPEVTVNGVTYEVPWGESIVIPGSGNYEVPWEETSQPEYVAPETYQTQAPDADETVPLGSPENPLYIDTSDLVMESFGHWYIERNIFEVLGWSYEYFLEQLQLAKSLPGSARTAEQEYAMGNYPTLELAQENVRFEDMVRQLGGYWIDGVLTPPASWSGSVTAFALYVRNKLSGGGTLDQIPLADEIPEPEPILNWPVETTIEPVETPDYLLSEAQKASRYYQSSAYQYTLATAVAENPELEPDVAMARYLSILYAS